MLKNGKDLSNGALKIELWNYTKKTHFPVFCQKFPQAMDEVEQLFFANFQILGPLGCQGWVVIPQNVKKKSKSLHPSVQVTMRELWFTGVRPLELTCGICFTALLDMAASRGDKMLAFLYVISFFRIVCLC